MPTIRDFEDLFSYLILITVTVLLLVAFVAAVAPHKVEYYYLSASAAGVVSVKAYSNWEIDATVYRSSNPDEAIAFLKAANASMK